MALLFAFAIDLRASPSSSSSSAHILIHIFIEYDDTSFVWRFVPAVCVRCASWRDCGAQLAEARTAAAAFAVIYDAFPSTCKAYAYATIIDTKRGTLRHPHPHPSPTVSPSCRLIQADARCILLSRVPPPARRRGWPAASSMLPAMLPRQTTRAPPFSCSRKCAPSSPSILSPSPF